MEEKTSEKNIIVIYHAECPDGFGSAYVAWKKFGDSAEYLPSFHKTAPPDVSGKDVYIMDYSYPREVFEEIKKKAHKLIMIDHHESNKENIKIADEFVFNNEHSGAVLTWKYFFPNNPIPKMFEYIEDVDLWRLALPKSKELGRFIESQEHNFKLWEELIAGFEDKNKFAKYIKKGDELVAEMNRIVEEIVSSAEEVTFEGYKTLIVNSEEYTSEVGNVLCQKLPPIGIIGPERRGKISVSLRGDGTADVSKLAQKYNGGGHKSAAGFVLENKEELNKIFNF